MKFRFNVHHHAHWTSEQHESPELPEVPALQRRRLSRLTKMALRVCFDMPTAAGLPSIFASRHGEISRTLSLLDQIVAGEPLSPAAFSQSVHNTASGTYSIQAQNRQASSALCAGAETLPMAFMEAWNISQYQRTPVLIVYADEPLASSYQMFRDEQDGALALGWIIEAHPQGQVLSEWKQSAAGPTVLCPTQASITTSESDSPPRSWPMSLAWQWWQQPRDERPSFVCQHPKGEWHWHEA